MTNNIIPFTQRERIMSKVGELIKEALMEAILTEKTRKDGSHSNPPNYERDPRVSDDWDDHEHTGRVYSQYADDPYRVSRSSPGSYKRKMDGSLTKHAKTNMKKVMTDPDRKKHIAKIKANVKLPKDIKDSFDYGELDAFIESIVCVVEDYYNLD